MKTLIRTALCFSFTIGFILRVIAQDAPTYDVYAIAFTNPIRENGKWIAVRNAPDTIEMCFMIWLIKGNNGKNILVDAGYVLPDSAVTLDKTGWIRPDEALHRLGLSAEEITDVIISHPHWDHINGVDLFPNATVWMQEEDYEYFVGTAWQKDGFSHGFDKKDVEKIVKINLEGRLHLVKGDSLEIMDGIRVFIGSKHTYESQYIQVTTGNERIILASDNIWFYFNYHNLISATLTFDTTAYVNQMKRMKTLASKEKLIVPGHDVQTFAMFPQVAEGIVKISSKQ